MWCVCFRERVVWRKLLAEARGGGARHSRVLVWWRWNEGWLLLEEQYEAWQVTGFARGPCSGHQGGFIHVVFIISLRP